MSKYIEIQYLKRLGDAYFSPYPQEYQAWVGFFESIKNEGKTKEDLK
jgi:hypothetical protein